MPFSSNQRKKVTCCSSKDLRREVKNCALQLKVRLPMRVSLAKAADYLMSRPKKKSRRHNSRIGSRTSTLVLKLRRGMNERDMTICICSLYCHFLKELSNVRDGNEINRIIAAWLSLYSSMKLVLFSLRTCLYSKKISTISFHVKRLFLYVNDVRYLLGSALTDEITARAFKKLQYCMQIPGAQTTLY